MEDTLLLDEGFNEKKLTNNIDIADANKVRQTINESNKIITKGKYAVIATLVLLAIGSIYEVVRAPDLMVYSIVGFVVILLLYCFGFYLFRKNPVTGLSVCLGIYILFNLLIIVGEPEMAFKGLVIKGLIIYYIVKGIQHAKLVPQQVEELKGIGVTKEDIDKINKQQELAKVLYLKNVEHTIKSDTE